MLVLLSGVSGAGKDTIKKELIKRMGNVESLPSFTDRLPREGEVDGEIYHFVATEEFERMIKDNELYEYDVHHEHYYGTSKKLMNEKIKSGKIIVKDMDVNGTESLMKLLKSAQNRFELVIAASKRARQIASGSEKLTDKDEASPVTLAADEIAEGKVKLC